MFLSDHLSIQTTVHSINWVAFKLRSMFVIRVAIVIVQELPVAFG